MTEKRVRGSIVGQKFQQQNFSTLSFIREKGLPPLVFLGGLLLVMEGVVQKGWVPQFLLPPPSQIVETFSKEWETIFEAAQRTLSEICISLLLSSFLAAALAIVLAISPLLKRMIYPFAVFFQTVPLIAIAPLVVIWCGFGKPAAIACSLIVSFFPFLVCTLLGLESTDPQLVELFRLYRSSRWNYVWKLKIPFGLPHFFSGLKIAAGIATVGSIIGEFTGGGGLGGLVDVARVQQRLDLVFAAILASSSIGLTLTGGIHLLTWLFLHRWHASEAPVES